MTITVTPVNDAPTLTSATAQTLAEDGSLTVLLAMTDGADIDDTLTNASIVVDTGANYTVIGTAITPTANFNGTLTVPVKVTDGTVTTAAVNMTVTVTPVNDAPTLTSATAQTIIEDSSLVISLDMLEGEADIDGNVLTVVPVAGTNYTVSGSSITPVTAFVGELAVSVTVHDGTVASDPVIMKITVLSGNDAPVLTSVSPFVMEQDLAITLSMDNIVATDSDGDALTLIIVDGENYTVSGTTITPASGFTGTLTINFQMYDGKDLSNVIALEVPVKAAGTNSIPELDEVDIPAIEKNNSLEVTLDMMDAFDNDDDNLTIILGIGDNYTVSGTTIIPADDYIGRITVPVAVTDGIDTSDVINATISIFVQIVDFHKGVIPEKSSGDVVVVPNPAPRSAPEVRFIVEAGESDQMTVKIFDQVGNLLSRGDAEFKDDTYLYIWNLRSGRAYGGTYVAFLIFSKDGIVIDQRKEMIGIKN